MIIDAHHHFWKYNTRDYGWMDDSMEVLRRDYLPSELENEINRLGVAGTVAVQARQQIEETAWLLELADKHKFIMGVVGWFDLLSADLDEQLIQYGNHSALVGARHVIHDESDDDFMLRPKFLKGIQALQAYDLTYDLLLFPKHIKRAIELVRMFPDQRFVLDHISKPEIKSGHLQPWKDDINVLASYPNIWCKVSGMVTEADLDNWKYEDFTPYLSVVVDAFGTERIMLGSDWPVCRLAGEYKEVMEIPLSYFKNLDVENKEKIYSSNAIECYQLENRNYGKEEV